MIYYLFIVYYYIIPGWWRIHQDTI